MKQPPYHLNSGGHRAAHGGSFLDQLSSQQPSPLPSTASHKQVYGHLLESQMGGVQLPEIK